MNTCAPRSEFFYQVTSGSLGVLTRYFSGWNIILIDSCELDILALQRLVASNKLSIITRPLLFRSKIVGGGGLGLVGFV